MSKTKDERWDTINEVKMRCITHNLEGELATKILFKMLDEYHNNGTTYIDKELKFCLRGDIPRKYVINLYNQKNRRDVVLIRAVQ